MRAAYRHTSSSPASEWSGVAMKNREHKKENILSWTCWVLQSIIFQVWSRRRKTYYLGGSARETKRERESCAPNRRALELCNWYFCSFSALLMLYSWYLCFLSTLLAMLCNCPATDSFARSFLSFYSQSAARPRLESGPPWHLQMQVHDLRVFRMFEKKNNFTPRYRYQM